MKTEVPRHRKLSFVLLKVFGNSRDTRNPFRVLGMKVTVDKPKKK